VCIYFYIVYIYIYLKELRHRWGYSMSSSIEANCFCCSVSVKLQLYRYKCKTPDTQIRKGRTRIHTHKLGENCETFRTAWKFVNTLRMFARIHPVFGPLHSRIRTLTWTPRHMDISLLIAANIQIFVLRFAMAPPKRTMRDYDPSPCWRHG